MRAKHTDPTPEMEAALIAAWHGKESKREIWMRLDTNLNYLEAMWARFRKMGKIPLSRRPNGKNSSSLSRYTKYTEKSDEDAETARRTASDELLALLREHHGCNEAQCGRYDLPIGSLRQKQWKRGAFIPRFIPKRELV